MKLWKLTQDVCTGWDTYDSAIVAAETEDDAKRIHPSPYAGNWDNTLSGRWEYESVGNWAFSPDDVHAELIGEALPGTRAGVILASFNAG